MDEFPKEYLDEMNREAISSARMLAYLIGSILLAIIGVIVYFIS